MIHEKSLMTEITELRTKADDASKGPKDPEMLKEYFSTSEALAGKVNRLMLSVENYPNLKSDQTMIMAMQSYNEVEAQIAAARRFYNASVTDLNNTIQVFPKNIVAAVAGIPSMPFYSAEEASKQAVNADLFLK
jgi:LemA protein